MVGHRGASGEVGENTVAAFLRAWREGADGIEGDFRLSADGVVVCFHDACARRVAGEEVVVAEAPMARLRELRDAEGRSVAPTFAEVAATVPPGGRFLVEVKGGVEMVAPLLGALGCSGLTRAQVVVMCFEVAVLRALRGGGWATWWLVDFACGDVARVVRDCGAVGVGGEAGLPTVWWREVAAAGVFCNAWTVDEVRRAEALREAGVGSFTTNFPRRLVRWRDGGGF